MTGLNILKVVAVAALLGGGFLIVGSLSSYYRAAAALESWPAADAVVTRSQVNQPGVGRASAKYQADFVFTFTVEGKEHTATLSASSRTFSREGSQKEADRFPLGSRHRIRYNPADPREIILDASSSAYFQTAIVPLGIGLVMAVIGVAVYTATLFKAKAQ
jgi:hypothetical protein